MVVGFTRRGLEEDSIATCREPLHHHSEQLILSRKYYEKYDIILRYIMLTLTTYCCRSRTCRISRVATEGSIDGRPRRVGGVVGNLRGMTKASRDPHDGKRDCDQHCHRFVWRWSRSSAVNECKVKANLKVELVAKVEAKVGSNWTRNGKHIQHEYSHYLLIACKRMAGMIRITLGPLILKHEHRGGSSRAPGSKRYKTESISSSYTGSASPFSSRSPLFHTSSLRGPKSLPPSSHGHGYIGRK